MNKSTQHLLMLIVIVAASIMVLKPQSSAAETLQVANQATVYKNLRLSKGYNFARSRANVLVAKDNQAVTEIEEDGDPTGPGTDISPTYLADRFELETGGAIRADFENNFPYSDEVFRDHTSLNTYYFYPSGYLLNYSKQDGFDINFLHRTKTDDTADELIVLTFDLHPRQLEGSMSLLRELARFAIKPANNKEVDLQRLPISSVEVNMSGLSSLIPQENVRIINSPQKVGDLIRVQATMTQSQKEDVVASIREGGLSGDISFKTYNNSFELVIPYYVSFTEFSGKWLTDIRELKKADSITNTSPFPLLFSGVVVYARPNSGDQIKRYDIPLATPVVMDSGAIAKADKTFAELVGGYGEVVSAWAAFERISCDECLDVIEKEILSSPTQASRVDLPIEAIPNIFQQFSLFKVLVEVKSSGFSASNEIEETKTFTLRADQAQASAVLFVDREDEEANDFEYRVKPFHSEGLTLDFGSWKPNQGVMDITITSADISPLMPEPEVPDQDSVEH